MIIESKGNVEPFSIFQEMTQNQNICLAKTERKEKCILVSRFM